MKIKAAKDYLFTGGGFSSKHLQTHIFSAIVCRKVGQGDDHKREGKGVSVIYFHTVLSFVEKTQIAALC